MPPSDAMGVLNCQQPWRQQGSGKGVPTPPANTRFPVPSPISSGEKARKVKRLHYSYFGHRLRKEDKWGTR